MTIRPPSASVPQIFRVSVTSCGQQRLDGPRISSSGAAHSVEGQLLQDRPRQHADHRGVNLVLVNAVILFTHLMVSS